MYIFRYDLIVDSFLKLIHDPAGSALAGAVLGSVLTLIVGYVSEYWKDVKFKKKVTKFVNTELECYEDFLNKLLVRGREKNGNMEFDYGTENIRWIKQMMPLPLEKLNSESYAKLTAETKSRVFDVETTIALNDVYRLIDYFEHRNTQYGGTTWLLFTKAEIEKILEEIKKVKSLFKRSFNMCHCLKTTCMTKSDINKLTRIVRYGLIFGVLIAIGAEVWLYYDKSESRFILSDGLIVIVILAITLYAAKKQKNELMDELKKIKDEIKGLQKK